MRENQIGFVCVDSTRMRARVVFVLAIEGMTKKVAWLVCYGFKFYISRIYTNISGIYNFLNFFLTNFPKKFFVKNKLFALEKLALACYLNVRCEKLLAKQEGLTMLFDESTMVDASKYALNAKATIQRNGRLGFTKEAADLLGLREGLAALFSVLPTGDMALVICDGEEPKAFKIQKAGEYFYIRMKNFFDSLSIDYINKRVAYDVSETTERYRGRVVYKFTRGIYERRTNENSEDVIF